MIYVRNDDIYYAHDVAGKYVSRHLATFSGGLSSVTWNGEELAAFTGNDGIVVAKFPFAHFRTLAVGREYDGCLQWVGKSAYLLSGRDKLNQYQSPSNLDGRLWLISTKGKGFCQEVAHPIDPEDYSQCPNENIEISPNGALLAFGGLDDLKVSNTKTWQPINLSKLVSAEIY